MNLKAFHVVFVILATALSAVIGLWSVGAYRAGSGTIYLVLALGSLLTVVALGAYGAWFLKKTKDVDYL
ncbi:MAG: hypothetical protein AAF481_13725 [Acidobacteriota bacterium]